MDKMSVKRQVFKHLTNVLFSKIIQVLVYHTTSGHIQDTCQTPSEPLRHQTNISKICLAPSPSNTFWKPPLQTGCLPDTFLIPFKILKIPFFHSRHLPDFNQVLDIKYALSYSLGGWVPKCSLGLNGLHFEEFIKNTL